MHQVFLLRHAKSSWKNLSSNDIDRPLNKRGKTDAKNLAHFLAKNKTNIKDKVFIGSNSSLVAPITINKDSIVGAGSVITKNVRKKSLALTRSLQTEIKNYKSKLK